MKRILITGSRNWTDIDTIKAGLRIAYGMKPGFIEVVEGEAEGADLLSKRAAYWLNDNEGYAFNVRKEPARWTDRCPQCPGHRRHNHRGDYCPAQGHIRNQRMVDLGDYLVCLAFPLGRSFGTWDCMKRAKAAGIHVFNLGDG